MSKLKEEWKSVIGYEGLYEVSDWGNVRSVDRWITNSLGRKRFWKGQTLKKVINSDGYYVITLHDFNHNQKEGKVHRLVAEAFIPNPENKSEVGHLKQLPDGTEDKTANEVWHLQWMTREENGNYGTIKDRLSKSRMGKNNPMFGKKRTLEARVKQSITLKLKNIQHGFYI